MRILCVDDDINLLKGMQRNLRKQFNIQTALGGEQGLKLLKEQGPFAVVMADMQMPQMDGLQFLKQVEERTPDSVRIMLTGNADQKTAMNAVNEGHVFRFLTKPCSPETITLALKAGLRQFRLLIAERELLENTLGGAIKVMTEILSMTDPDTFDQSQRLKDYTSSFTRSSPLRSAWEVEVAAMLSQIGRITIPPTILAKARAGLSLTGLEQDVLNRVPEVGAALLERIPRMDNVAQFIRYQEKHFDGSGHPADKLQGEDIAIGARILKVLGDLIRLEDKGLSKAAALQQMQKQIGTYDSTVLVAASRCFDIALTEAVVDKAPAQLTRIDDLIAGDVLGQELRTSEGVLIIAKSTELTPMLIEKLKNFNTLQVIDETILVHPK